MDVAMTCLPAFHAGWEVGFDGAVARWQLSRDQSDYDLTCQTVGKLARRVTKKPDPDNAAFAWGVLVGENAAFWWVGDTAHVRTLRRGRARRARRAEVS